MTDSDPYVCESCGKEIQSNTDRDICEDCGDSDPSDTVTARHWFCPTCGDEIDIDEECESWPCVECGTEMQPQTRKSEYIPVEILEALEELVERWRLNADCQLHPCPELQEKRTDELQEIIDDYQIEKQ